MRRTTSHGDKRNVRTQPRRPSRPRPGHSSSPAFFLAAANRLGAPIETCVVVGDSVWDLLAAQRAGALGIGLLSGGYGREELERSGAYRVYADPAEMLTRLEEVGVRPLR